MRNKPNKDKKSDYFFKKIFSRKHISDTKMFGLKSKRLRKKYTDMFYYCWPVADLPTIEWDEW